MRSFPKPAPGSKAGLGDTSELAIQNNMSAAQPSFFARHRNKFLIGVGTLTSLYLGGQWVSAKLSEMSERAALERTAKENLRKRFEQNQSDCAFTTMALLPDLGERWAARKPTSETRADQTRPGCSRSLMSSR